MANEKRLIDANAIKYRTIGCGGWGQPEEVADKYNIDQMPTVDAVSVEDLERILSTTPGLELWDYQKRGIMSAVCRLCGKEKNDG